MQQVPRDDGVNIWKVSNRSVGQAIELYEAFGYGLLANYLSEKLPRVSILGVELFKWVLALAAGFAAYAVSYLLGRSIVLLVSAPASPNYKRLRYFFTVPVGLLVAIFIFNIVLDTLGIGITAQEIARGRTLGIIVLTWVVLSAVGMLRDAYAQRLEHEGKPGAVVLLRPAVNAINVIIVLSALLLWLDNIGFNITTLLAGLGVGSVAVALALQKPLEDIFGALSLYTQQPIRIGDFCRIGSDIGSVEEIGLRATRIRTLANTVVSIPNSKVAAGQIDNISARQMILYSPKLRLRYDTTGEQVQTILRAIRELLRSNEHIVQESPRVRFQEFGDTALILEVFAYVDTTDWAKYLEYAEELNLQILKIINQAGTNLALPVRVLLRGDEDAVD
jgi:MscS family membrane protein